MTEPPLMLMATPNNQTMKVVNLKATIDYFADKPDQLKTIIWLQKREIELNQAIIDLIDRGYLFADFSNTKGQKEQWLGDCEAFKRFGEVLKDRFPKEWNETKVWKHDE